MKIISREELKKVAVARLKNPYVDLLPFILGIGGPVVNYNNLILEKREVIMYALKVTGCEETGFIGYSEHMSGSAGSLISGMASARATKNVTPTINNIKEYTKGELVVTNKRIVFIAPKHTFEYHISKVTACSVLSKDSFMIQLDNVSETFFTCKEVNEYVVSVVNYAASAYVNEIDLYSEYIEKENNIPVSDFNTYVQLENEVLKICNRKKMIRKVIWGGVICYIIGCVCMLSNIFMESAKEKAEYEAQVEAAKKSYTIEELLLLEDHPRMGDLTSSCEEYYANIKGDDAQLLTSDKYSNMDWSRDSHLGGEHAIYFIQDDTDEEYLDNVEINIKDGDIEGGMNLDKAVEIIKSYLPAGFEKYYSFVRAYSYETKGVGKRYIYSMSINEEGRTYRNSTKIPYSNNISVYITHSTDEKTWRLIGNKAYKDNSISWINKHTEPWEVNWNEVESE